MIINSAVFEETYLPRRLLYRDQEIAQLSRAFQPAINGTGAEDALITGPSGVGKTVLSRFTLDQLESQTSINVAHVRCLGMTDAEILQSILDQIGHNTHDSWMVTDLREELLRNVDQPTIVVLDEADGLPNTGALHQLTGIPHVSTVAICHDAADWLARLDADLRRRFEGDHTIRLDRYGVDELADILETRGDQGLMQGVVSRGQQTRIADDVAGVARYGIQTLRAAAELAFGNGHRTITESDIDDGLELARRRIRKANLHSLPFHHHVLYALICDAGEIGVSELHARYESIADSVYYGRDLTPIGRRARRNKLEKLRRYHLVEWDGDGRGRRYWVCDEAIAPPIDLDLCQTLQ